MVQSLEISCSESKSKTTNTFILICSVLFLIFDFILIYSQLQFNIREMKELNLEKSFKYLHTNMNIYSFNQSKANPMLIKQVTNKNFKFLKELMEPPAGNYLHEPIANFFLNFFLIPYSHNFLSYRSTANFITSICLLISIPIFALLMIGLNDTFYRRMACVLFQIRNVLDYMDGNLARLDKKFDGTNFDFGRAFDGYGSSFPSFFLIVGSYVFILSNLNLSDSDASIIKIDFLYGNLYKIVEWLRVKLRLDCKTVYTITTKLDVIKDVYFKLILFIVYIIAAGITWNNVYDSNVKLYGDYLEIDGVRFFFTDYRIDTLVSILTLK